MCSKLNVQLRLALTLGLLLVTLMRRWMEDARTALQSFSCARVFLYIEVQGPSSPRLLAGSRPFLPAWSRILQWCIRMKNKCRMYLMVSCTCAQEELPFSFPTFETRYAAHAFMEIYISAQRKMLAVFSTGARWPKHTLSRQESSMFCVLSGRITFAFAEELYNRWNLRRHAVNLGSFGGRN